MHLQTREHPFVGEFDHTRSEGHRTDTARTKMSRPEVYGVKMKPARKYVWNNYLLKKFESTVQEDWILHIIYGFIQQSSILLKIYNLKDL